MSKLRSLRSLPISDASRLALLAEHSDISAQAFTSLYNSLQSREARQIAQALYHGDASASAAVREAARSIRDWVELNRIENQRVGVY
jgi:hypothetical protein